MRIGFIAVHESAVGTRRTSPSRRSMSAYWGIRQTYWPIDFVSDEVVNSIDQMELLTFLAMDSGRSDDLAFRCIAHRVLALRCLRSRLSAICLLGLRFW